MKPRLGISACLLGELTRYDGRQKLHHFLRDQMGRYVEWVPICPEVECGLPVPREPMSLTSGPDGEVRLLANESGRDLTEQLMTWAGRRVAELGGQDLWALVLKSRSPSCGLRRVKIRGRDGMVKPHGTGLFAALCREQLPNIPLLEEPEMDRILKKQTTVDATLEQTWEAWTTVDGLKTFFAPAANVELRPGGLYEILFFPDAEPGRRGAEGLHVLSYLPRQMLSFQWNAPPQYPTARDQLTWVVVEFGAISATADGRAVEGRRDDINRRGERDKDAAPGRVEVTLTHLGWGEGGEWDQVYQYFDSAWDVVLRRLALSFSSGPMDWDSPDTPRAG